jgi:hypothetical protein
MEVRTRMVRGVYRARAKASKCVLARALEHAIASACASAPAPRARLTSVYAELASMQGGPQRFRVMRFLQHPGAFAAPGCLALA